MKSMTGHGRGESSRNGFKITVELVSVNRKQNEISVVLPRQLETLEAQVREAINHRISRGRINVHVVMQAVEEASNIRVAVNIPLARQYAQSLRLLAKELGMTPELTIDQIARVPGVLQAEDAVSNPEEYRPVVQKALDQALNMLVAMRQREGSHLAKDLELRIQRMKKAAGRIRKRVPLVVKRFQKQLQERLVAGGLPKNILDEPRFLQEVVMFADKADITEELTRLQSHFQQYDDCRKSSQPVGRTLDFLAQELNREINTIGSKANDSLITREVVSMKAELERFREQVQNIE
jgi:uncharacterized protein (TIGR00255 family)